MDLTMMTARRLSINQIIGLSYVVQRHCVMIGLSEYEDEDTNFHITALVLVDQNLYGANEFGNWFAKTIKEMIENARSKRAFESIQPILESAKFKLSYTNFIKSKNGRKNTTHRERRLLHSHLHDEFRYP